MRVALVAVCLLASSSLSAADRPSSGIVYNTKDPQALTFECTQSGAEMICSFTQSAVSRKAAPEDLAKVLHQGKTEFVNWLQQAPKECPQIEMMDEVLSGRKPAPDEKKFIEGIRNTTQTQKADLQRSIAALVAACRDRTEARYLTFLRHSHDVSTRSCRVWTSNYSQRFRQVGTATGPWVVVDSPTGPCGSVNVSRFERADGNASMFWRYFSKKIVTNKAGEFFPGASCSGLDEAEYLFDWKSIDRQMGCDYVSFGPF